MYPCCFPGTWNNAYFEELCAECGVKFGTHCGEHPHRGLSSKCSGFRRSGAEARKGSMALSEAERNKILAAINQLEAWISSWSTASTGDDMLAIAHQQLRTGTKRQILELKRQLAEEENMASSKKANWWDSLKMLIPAGRRGLLVGPPGTGKSTTAAQLLKKITGHAHRITMTEGTGIEDLIGMYQLKDGETIWCDGPAVKAMKEGTGLIIDEVDKHSAEVGSLFYALLDDEPQVTLPTGEHVIADNGYKVLCTSNANISALPEAIIDRMEFVLLAMAPHPDAMEQLTKPEAAAVTNYYRGVAPTNWQWTGLVTLRRMRSFHKLLGVCKDEVIVAEAVFGQAGKEVLSSLVTSAVAGR